jgi:hypothetical protein
MDRTNPVVAPGCVHVTYMSLGTHAAVNTPRMFTGFFVDRQPDS